MVDVLVGEEERRDGRQVDAGSEHPLHHVAPTVHDEGRIFVDEGQHRRRAMRIAEGRAGAEQVEGGHVEGRVTNVE